jgi:hypothetical protein
MARNIYTGANTPPAKKRAFARARAEGMSVSAASRTAKISRDLGYALDRQLLEEQSARDERRRNRTIGSAAGMGLAGMTTSRQTMASGRAGTGNPWAHNYATMSGDDLPGPVPVEDLVDEAAQSLHDFGLFRRRYLGRGPSPWQEDAGTQLARLLIAAQEDQTREFVVVNAPPGGGKSTLFTHDLVCWLICRDRRIRILIGSRTSGQAMKYTQRVRSTLQQRVLYAPRERDLRLGLATEPTAVLVEDFGRFKPQGRTEVWQKGGFTVAQFGDEGTGEKEPTVTAFGFDSDYLGMRVDLAIWDDLVDYDNIRNMDVVENLQNDWDGVAEKRIDPGGVCVLQGQRLGHNDLYRYCLDKRTLPDDDVEEEDGEVELVPKYRHILYRAHDESNCQRLHKRTDPPWRPDGRGGCLLDPRRLPWNGRDGIHTIAENQPDIYRVVYQQEDLDPASALIQKVWVDGGFDRASNTSHIGCWDADRAMWQRPANLQPPFHLIVSVDPSPSNWWAMQFWAYEPATERRYLIALDRRRMDSSDFIDWDLDRHVPTGFLEEWWQKADEIGMRWHLCILEVNTAQKWLDQSNAATRWKVLRDVSVLRHTTGPAKTDKDLGIRSVKNHWKTGRIRLPGRPDGSKQQALLLVNEMLRWPNGTTDDQVMAHWFVEFNLPRVAPRRPTGEATPTQRVPSWMRGQGVAERKSWNRVFASIRRSDVDATL